MVTQQPTGIVAFLFTDVENSTAMWEQLGGEMASKLEAHDRIVREVIDVHDGYVFSTAGDSFSVAFRSTSDAVEAATQIQRALAASGGVEGIRVRIGIHTGEASLRDGDYFGPSVNRAARIMSLGHGGQILVSETTASVIGDSLSEVRVTDLGVHGLSGFQAPERVFQAEDGATHTEFPPLRSTSLVRHNLPEQPTPFIGRRDELSDLSELLGSNRAVTILAAGGAGKSRLAIELGHREGHRYSDGVFFVPLAPRANPGEVPEAIAESLGISSVSTTDTMMQVLDYLATKEQLLILDNFEHVREAARDVSAILESAPGVSVVITSRSRLGLRGESIYQLGGLKVDWSDRTEALEQSGTQLFMDAAQRRDPGFELTDEDIDDLATVLELVDGLPLAIEIAASWIDILPVSEIASEIEANVDFLESEMSDVPERHRSIRAVFDYSWRTLSDREKLIFPKLSVFRGGFTRQAAERIAGATLRDLSGLADRSLLLPSRATGRFTVHELLRQYAEAHLDEVGQTEETLDAHASFYSDIARGVFNSIKAGDQEAALATTEQDLANLRAGFRRAAMHDPPAARHFLECLWFIHEIRSWLAAGETLFRDAASIARSSTAEGSDQVAALSEAEQSWFITLMGRAEDGLELATAAHSEVMASDPSVADACLAQQSRNIGLLFLDPEAIGPGTKQAQALAERDDEEWWRMTLQVWEAYSHVFDPSDTGPRLAVEGVDYFAAIGDHWVQVWPLGFLGARAEQSGDLEEARRRYEQSLALGRDIEFGRIVQYMLNALGRVTTAQGDYNRAESYIVEGLGLSLDAGQAREIVGGIVDIAAIRVGQHRWTEAATLLAVVASDSLRSQRTAFGATPISELADGLETEVEAALGSAELSDIRASATDATARDVAVSMVADPGLL